MARTVDFNKLPPRVRERLVACVRGQAKPEPILRMPDSRYGEHFASVLGMVLLLGGTGALHAFGRGPMFYQHPFYVLGYWIGLALVLVILLGMVRLILSDLRRPLAQGVYMFPADLVIVKQGTLTLHALSELSATPHVLDRYRNGRHTTSTLTLELGGAKEQIHFHEAGVAEKVVERMVRENRALMAALAARDMATLAAQDAFFECKSTGVWESAEPAPKALCVAPLGRFWNDLPRRLTAVGAAFPIALGGWHVRNVVMDDRAFDDAMSQRGSFREQQLKDYVSYGGRRADEARTALGEGAPKGKDSSKFTFPKEVRARVSAKAASRSSEAFLGAVLDQLEGGTEARSICLSVAGLHPGALMGLDNEMKAKARGKPLASYAKNVDPKLAEAQLAADLTRAFAAALGSGAPKVVAQSSCSFTPKIEFRYQLKAAEYFEYDRPGGERGFFTLTLDGSATFSVSGRSPVEIRAQIPALKVDKDAFQRRTNAGGQPAGFAQRVALSVVVFTVGKLADKLTATLWRP